MSPNLDEYWWTALVVVLMWSVVSYLLTYPLLKAMRRRRTFSGLPFTTTQALLGIFNLGEACVYLYALQNFRSPGSVPEWPWLIRHVTFTVLIFLGLRAVVGFTLYFMLRKQEEGT